MIVIVNTSPLILLAKIGQLDLLAHLYSEVIVPDAVWVELQAKPGHEAQQIEMLIQGLLPSIRRELDRLVEAGMWLDELFYHRVLQEFGE